jgi:hypothetical protein
VGKTAELQQEWPEVLELAETVPEKTMQNHPESLLQHDQATLPSLGLRCVENLTK